MEKFGSELRWKSVNFCPKCGNKYLGVKPIRDENNRIIGAMKECNVCEIEVMTLIGESKEWVVDFNAKTANDYIKMV